MQTQTRARNGGANEEVSIEDGMGGEGDSEAATVGQEMHVSVKNGIGGGDMEARFRMG
jgi:hypothetical protein